MGKKSKELSREVREIIVESYNKKLSECQEFLGYPGEQ